LLTLIYIGCWVAFALWKPWNLKHFYDLTTSVDEFRLSVFIIGILLNIFFLYKELKKVYSEYIYEKVNSNQIFIILLNIKTIYFQENVKHEV
jgi:hypothetical protein